VVLRSQLKEEGFLAMTSMGDKLFHSFRHTMTTQLERAGVEPLLIKRILGHALDDVTFGRYSKGNSGAILAGHSASYSCALHSKPARFKDWITND
jgi:integrase